MWIEKWLEDNNGYWKTHLEFPGGSRERNIDALVLSKLAYGVINGTRSSPVSYGWSDAPVIGEVFEIEPMNAARIAEGRDEVRQKLDDLDLDVAPFRHQGILPFRDAWPLGGHSLGAFAGAAYDWREVDWQLGTRLSPGIQRGPVRVMINVPGVFDYYWIMLVEHGLIVYGRESKLHETFVKVGGGGLAFGAPWIAEYFQQLLEKAKQRGNVGQPQPQPEPMPDQCDPIGIPDPWLIPVPLPFGP